MKKIYTKNFLLGLGFIFIGSLANAQNGLENIIVEKYYVSNAADAAASTTAGAGNLPVGSVTYRIFADMLPGYNFQMAYGDANHMLSITTTTSFFNNIDRGSTSPTYSKANAAKNTVMLDSWLTVGAACAGNFGVLKTEDNGVANVVNSNGVLKNNDATAGIPLTTQDGIIAVTGRVPASFSTIGQVNDSISVFDTCETCKSFTITDGAWYVLGGAVGPDSTINKVLIAQITTNGTFAFALNIQIGTPTGGTQKYVSSNPLSDEITIPSLIYNSTTVSVENKESASSFVNAYPNPVQDLLSLEFTPSNINSVNNSYTIIDVLGKTLIHKELGTLSGKHIENVDVSALPKGLYFVELSLDGFTSTKKIIKN